MKIYISGPMSGLPDLNKAAFTNAERALEDRGHEVVNPVRNGVPDTAPWLEHMRADIKMLMDCDAVAYLPGSEGSRGAKVEMELARALGLPVLPYAKWL